MNKEQFFSLTPDRVLEAVEAGGLACTGLCYPLNSLENRVYEIEREDRSRVVAKFYRPGRWSEETILDEHRFLTELEAAEIPVCAPLVFPEGTTLKQVEGTSIWYALFPKVGGRAPEEFTDDQLGRLGTLVARIHNVGAARPALHRRHLTPETYGTESLETLETLGVIPLELRDRFRGLVERLVEAITPLFEGVPVHRVHGDCHPGNLLWGSQGAFFLDFDDMVTAPAVQDIWMLVPGRDAWAERQRDVLLEGYRSFRDFDRSTLKLIEPLRALRYLHYCAWVSRRWEDPSFPAAFPQYGTARYWQELTDDLEEQLTLVGGREQPQGRRAAPAAPVGVSVRFVPVNHADFQRILTVRTEVFVEELERDLDDELDGLDRLGLHLLAEDDKGRAIGAARLLEHDGTTFIKLSRVAVMPGARRQGVGRALVRKAEEYAHMVGAPGVVVETRIEAIPFFGTLGYLVEGKPFPRGNMTLRRMVREWG